MRKILCGVLLLIFSSWSIADHGMNQDSLERIVKAMAQNSKGEQGVVEFDFNNVLMYLISDVKHNRMRIVAPIASYDELSREQLDAIMVSNYHKALDARYAVSENILYSVYIHPMSELNEGQIRAAVKQVANLATSFGSDYSSGGLSFGSAHE